MNAGQGFRRAPGSPLRIAAGDGAAALIATLVSAARRARRATADRDSGPAQGSQVPPPAVPVSPLRSGATAPGAPSGPLAAVTAQAAPGVSPSPAAPEAARACGLAAGQVAISAALLLLTVTALPAIVGRRRASGKRGAAHARTPGRQAENGDDAIPPEIPADIGDPWTIDAPRSGRPDPARNDAGQPRHDAQRPRHADDYPSWPGRPGPHALHPDHPSWGGGRTDPRWDATEQALRQDGYPSWPEFAAPPWHDAEPLAANDSSGWRGGGRPARHESPPAPYRGPHGRPATGQSATGPRHVLPAPTGTDLGSRAGFAPRASSAAGPGVAPYTGTGSRPVSVHPGDFGPGPGPIHQAGYAPGPGPVPRAGYAPQGFAPRPGYVPGPGPASRTGFAPRHGPVLQRGATGVMEGVRPGVDRIPEVYRGQYSPGQIWDTGSVELATRIISEANQQAAEIRHEARDDAATARADAKQEAARLVQQAADQAAATLAAAELQATKVRAEILKLSADLGGAATSFTESLLSPPKPAAKPTADPPAMPSTPAVARMAAPPPTAPTARLAPELGAKPATKLATRPAGVPATRPGVSPRRAKPKIREAGKPKNRQASAARKVTIALVALSLAGAATGATELVLHGPAFFVFRANGAGASQTGPEEDQGPGQPNAPGAHHHAKVIPAGGQPVKPVPHKTEKPK
jgi:hypothetical protein